MMLDLFIEYEEEIVVKDRKDIYFNMVTVNCVGLWKLGWLM